MATDGDIRICKSRKKVRKQEAVLLVVEILAVVVVVVEWKR